MTDDRSGADNRLQRAACEGCAESRLLISRRAMLGVTAGLFSWAYMPRFAYAGADDPRFVVVLLRGGMDGMNVCVPLGDKNYIPLRGSIAIPAASTIKLNSFFGLHPALKNFGAMYKSGDASVVHAVSVPLRSRSHFDAQDNLENGMPGFASNATGWINRLLSGLPAGDPIATAGGIQIGEAPLIMRGPAPVLGWSANSYPAVVDPTLAQIRTLFQQQDIDMSDALERGLQANNLANPLDQDDGAISELRKGFRGAGRLMAAVNGPRVAVLSVSGFDTHANQGGVQGELAVLLTELDRGLGDFKVCAGAAWSKTVVILATEFGRNAKINGDHGTDHGVGTVALLAGGAVRGGVIADWPGLAPAQLYEGVDLKPTSDVRAVFKGVLRDHLGVSTTLLNNTVFPSSTTVLPMANLVKTVAPASSASAPRSPVPLKVERSIAAYRRRQAAANLGTNVRN